MNPLTINPVTALDFARQTNAERIRQAEQRRRAARVSSRPRRRRRLVATRPWRRRFAVTA
jgi:hypothetical protein